VSAQAGQPEETRRLADAVGAALRGSKALTVYPPIADRRDRVRRIVTKGGADLSRQLDDALREFKLPSAGRGIIDVEVDPVEWPF